MNPDSERQEWTNGWIIHNAGEARRQYQALADELSLAQKEADELAGELSFHIARGDAAQERATRAERLLKEASEQFSVRPRPMTRSQVERFYDLRDRIDTYLEDR